MNEVKNATITGYEKIPNSLYINSKLTPNELCVLMIFHHFIGAKKKDGSPWQINKEHIKSCYLSDNDMSQRSFRTAMEGLKRKGYLTQFRVPSGKNNKFEYIYFANFEPETAFDHCVECKRDGTIMLNGEAVSQERMNERIKFMQKELHSRCAQNTKNTGEKRLEVPTGEVRQNAAATIAEKQNFKSISEYAGKVKKSAQTFDLPELTEILTNCDFPSLAQKFGADIAAVFENGVRGMFAMPRCKINQTGEVLNSKQVKEFLCRLNYDKMEGCIQLFIDNNNGAEINNSAMYLANVIYNNVNSYIASNVDIFALPNHFKY